MGGRFVGSRITTHLRDSPGSDVWSYQRDWEAFVGHPSQRVGTDIPVWMENSSTFKGEEDEYERSNGLVLIHVSSASGDSGYRRI